MKKIIQHLFNVDAVGTPIYIRPRDHVGTWVYGRGKITRSRPYIKNY